MSLRGAFFATKQPPELAGDCFASLAVTDLLKKLLVKMVLPNTKSSLICINTCYFTQRHSDFRFTIVDLRLVIGP